MSIINAWRAVAQYVAAHPAEFSGRSKETLVFRRVRREIRAVASTVRIVGPDSQERFRNWNIDLVCTDQSEKIAVEGKFKIRNDGAVPDNRKAAFFDLYKLEACVDSGEYSAGLFLWLTDEPAYFKPATGDSRDFSTHRGRVCEAGVPLHARRSRNAMPLPLVLTRRYVFEWESVSGAGWHHLMLAVGSKSG